MTKKQAKIILTFADNDMKIKPTAEQLYLNQRSITYHLDKIQKQMGWNPRKFYDLCYLVGVAMRMHGTKLGLEVL